MQRTIFSVLFGAMIITILLFLINWWLGRNNEGVFLTQETYMGTVTWYEDSKTPPVPSELKKPAPLISSATPPKQAEELEDSIVTDVLNIVTANGEAGITLEPESLDTPTTTITTPPKKPVTPTPKVEIKQNQPTPTPPSTVVPKNTPSSSIISSSTQRTLHKIFLTKDTARPLRIESSHPVAYKAFYLAAPERIVIDFEGKIAIENVQKSVQKNKYISDVRIAYNGANTRIVIDLPKKPRSWDVKYATNKNALDVLLAY